MTDLPTLPIAAALLAAKWLSLVIAARAYGTGWHS